MKAPPKILWKGEVAEAFVNEAVVSAPSDARPVVATYGCAPCMAVAGYNRKSHIGFIAHFSVDLIVKRTLAALLEECQQYAKSPRWEITLIGGNQSLESRKIYKAILHILKKETSFKLQIDDRTVHSPFHATSLALDTRTGQTFPYDPKQNSLARRLDEEDASLALASHLEGSLSIVYEPR